MARKSNRLRFTPLPNARRGSALVLTALAIIPLLAMVAFAVDWGRICVTKAELQRAADASAMAAASELKDAKSARGGISSAAAQLAARLAAKQFAALNTSSGKPLQLQDSDIEIGYVADPRVPGTQLDKSDPDRFNVVRVRVRRDAESNGAIPMFFARILGKDEAESNATATAAFIDNVGGFQKPLREGADGPYLPILPFALDLNTWINGIGPDEWSWDESSQKFVPGSDGVPEFNLYPQQTGSAANRGIVKIGTNTPDTPHISHQILYGVSSSDLAFHGGSLAFDKNGELFLEGTPGLRAVFEKDFAAIQGQGRIVPVFSKVEGDGNNAVYTIVAWAGFRIIDVDLTGKNRRLIVQASDVSVTGVVPAVQKGKSKFVTSRVWLSQ